MSDHNDRTDHIHILGNSFDYENIEIATPNGMQGGTYFTKITYNQLPLYAQTPKCETRQGIVLNGKKAHYDIIVADSSSDTVSDTASKTATMDQVEFVDWLERVEDHVIHLLHEKGRLWFTNELSVEDIKELFTPPIKSYRGGKQLLVRINVSPSKINSNQFGCKIFDERENPTTIEYVKPEHSVISIVEIAGIRFTSRSFQLELVSKQMAVLANTRPLFETCLIKKDAGHQTQQQITHAQHPLAATSTTTVVAEVVEVAEVAEELVKTDESALAEVHLDVPIADSITIKNPLEVYYAMYRAAKKRASEAKKIALEAYLDAKNIKNVYKLNLSDEDDEDEDEDDDDDNDGGENDDGGEDENDDGGEDEDDDGGEDEDDDGDDDGDDGNSTKKKPITITDSEIVVTVDELI